MPQPEKWIEFGNPTEGIPEESFDGVFVDVPIRPLSESGAGNPLYRVRVYFAKNGSETNAPVPPAFGCLVKCSFTTIDVINSGPPLVTGRTKIHLEADILATSFGANPLVAASQASFDGGAVRLSPVAGVSEWIYHSQGAPFTSAESKVYIQSGWSWTNWKIRNNYLEVAFTD